MATKKIKIAAFILILILPTAYIFFMVIDFTENDPKFCITCHLMQKAYSAWEVSVHKEINCHECHSASILQKNIMLLRSLTKKKFFTAKKHDKTIVPRKVCKKCHWDGDNEIIKINTSYGHAKHAFMNKFECTICHHPHKWRITQTAMQDVCTQCHKSYSIEKFFSGL